MQGMTPALGMVTPGLMRDVAEMHRTLRGWLCHPGSRHRPRRRIRTGVRFVYQHIIISVIAHATLHVSTFVFLVP